MILHLYTLIYYFQWNSVFKQKMQYNTIIECYRNGTTTVMITLKWTELLKTIRRESTISHILIIIWIATNFLQKTYTSSVKYDLISHNLSFSFDNIDYILWNNFIPVKRKRKWTFSTSEDSNDWRIANHFCQRYKCMNTRFRIFSLRINTYNQLNCSNILYFLYFTSSFYSLWTLPLSYLQSDQRLHFLETHFEL